MQTFYDHVEMFSCCQTTLYGLLVVSVQIYNFKYISAEEILNIQRVTINIADTNDNKPYFKNEFYQAGSVLSLFSFCLPSSIRACIHVTSIFLLFHVLATAPICCIFYHGISD